MFALCTNEAAGTVKHPALGKVPTCSSCADKPGLEFDTPLVVWMVESVYLQDMDADSFGVAVFATQLGALAAFIADKRDEAADDEDDPNLASLTDQEVLDRGTWAVEDIGGKQWFTWFDAEAWADEKVQIYPVEVQP